MRSIAPALAGLVLGLAATGEALAAEPTAAPSAPSVAGDNFAFAPAEGRHLKIDRRSGSVSLCEETAAEWRCRLVPDDRAAYEEEIARLRAEVETLTARLAAQDAAPASPRQRSLLDRESEAEVDRFFDFTDRAFRRFFGLVEDLKRDFEDPNRI